MATSTEDKQNKDGREEAGGSHGGDRIHEAGRETMQHLRASDRKRIGRGEILRRADIDLEKNLVGKLVGPKKNGSSLKFL